MFHKNVNMGLILTALDHYLRSRSLILVAEFLRWDGTEEVACRGPGELTSLVELQLSALAPNDTREGPSPRPKAQTWSWPLAETAGSPLTTDRARTPRQGPKPAPISFGCNGCEWSLVDNFVSHYFTWLLAYSGTMYFGDDDICPLLLNY